LSTNCRGETQLSEIFCIKFLSIFIHSTISSYYNLQFDPKLHFLSLFLHRLSKENNCIFFFEKVIKVKERERGLQDVVRQHDSGFRGLSGLLLLCLSLSGLLRPLPDLRELTKRRRRRRPKGSGCKGKDHRLLVRSDTIFDASGCTFPTINNFLCF